MTILVSIVNNVTAATFAAQFTDQPSADAWIAQNVANGSWGQAAIAAQPAVMADDGVTVISPAVTAVPCQYTITQTDITAQLAAAQAVLDAHAYLKSTDWQAIRLADTGEAMDADVKAQRAAARLVINPPLAAAPASTPSSGTTASS